MKAGRFFALAIAAAIAAGATQLQAAQQQPVPQQPAGTPPAAAGWALADAVPDKNGIKRMVLLRGLDKISGRATDISAPAGLPVAFGTLTITARYCYTVPPEEPPETAAFIQIDDGNPLKRVFSGWMFASTPALNGLAHPVYDVWVITCKTEEPATAPATGSATPESSTPMPARPSNP